jgi:cytochrome c-type biogenesis protein CcmH
MSLRALRSPLRARVAPFTATLLLALASLAPAQPQELDPRVFEIAGALRCPTCVSESVAQSSSPIAREMRAIIQEQLDAGANRGEVLAFFQERYGDWILLEPPKRGLHLVVWLAPVAAMIAGAALLVVLLRRWRVAGDTPVAADPVDLARVRAALAAERDDAGRV